MHFQELFAAFDNIRVGVIGDVMLDTYMWGHVERISPEAPVPIVALEKKEYRIGGAGNVALNLKALGAKPHVLSVMGDDEDGQRLDGLFREQGIGTNCLLTSTNRVTTNKMRIIGRNQQMMRLDREITKPLRSEEEELFIERVSAFLEDEKPSVVIFEDYNKGVLTKHVISELLKRCAAAGVITTVDPKRKNFFSYRGVDIFKPNLKEAKEALNIIEEGSSPALLDAIHQALNARLHHKISLITLSEKGAYFSDGQSGTIIPSHLRSIADVSGAGDTVIAVASLVYAVTKDMKLMGEMANIAGGLVCEEVGTAAVDKERLLRECERLLV